MITRFKTHITRPDLSNSRWYDPHLFFHLVPSEATDGQISLIEFLGQAGGEPPLHVHSREDEFFYILDGDFTFEAGGQKNHAPTGTFVWFPKDVQHAFVSHRPTGRGLVGLLPGAFEKWFIDFSSPAEAMVLPPASDAGYTMDIDAMLRSGSELGVEFLPPDSMASKPNPQATTQPFVSSRENSPVVCLTGMTMHFLALPAQTDSVLTVVENVVDTEGIIPLHTKPYIEVAYVLEGEGRFQVGDEFVDVRPGSTLSIPASEKRGYQNTGSSPLTVLHLLCGGRFDQFAKEIEPFYTELAEHESEVAEILERHQMTLIGI